jgi:hypothetical protein
MKVIAMGFTFQNHPPDDISLGKQTSRGKNQECEINKSYGFFMVLSFF